MNPVTKPAVLGKVIQRIRKYKDISHLDMMDLLNVSQPTYSRIENGQKEIDTLMLQKIADKMEMTPEDILAEAKGQGVVINNYHNTIDGNGSSNNGNDVVNNQASSVEKELYDKLIAEKDKQLQEKNELLTQQAEQIKVLQQQLQHMQEQQQRLTERLLELR